MQQQYSLDVLERAKEIQGFDEFVSTVIATRYKQKADISVQKLTAEVKVRFNNGKMKRMSGEPDDLAFHPVSRLDKTVFFKKGHDEIEAVSRRVIEEYYRLMQDSGASKKSIREGATILQVALEMAIRSIPLSKVRIH